MRETLPFLVLNSLEGKDDPCKSDCPTFYHLWKISCTLPIILLNSLERKDDPCKGDSKHITLFEKTWHFTLFSVKLNRKERRPCKSDYTHFEQTCDTLFLLVFIYSERKDNPCKSDTSTLYPYWKYAWNFTHFSA